MFRGLKYTLKTIIRISIVKLAWIHCVDEIATGAVPEPRSGTGALGGRRRVPWAVVGSSTLLYNLSPWEFTVLGTSRRAKPASAYPMIMSCIHWLTSPQFHFTEIFGIGTSSPHFRSWMGSYPLSPILPSPRKLLRINTYIFLDTFDGYYNNNPY